jgi:putative endonuclease
MGTGIFPSSKKVRLSGAAAEQLALNFLQSKGLKFVTKNFRTRRGEIDLIMLDNAVLVFVEVRFRSSVSFGSAEESITAQKCQRLSAAAQAYMQREGLTEKVSARFDAVAISPYSPDSPDSPDKPHRESTSEYCINWIQNILQ